MTGTQVSPGEKDEKMNKWLKIITAAVLCVVLTGCANNLAGGNVTPEAVSETTVQGSETTSESIETDEIPADKTAAEYPAGNPEDVACVILHTNDVHVGFEDNIGYDGLSLYREELKELYDNVLLVDAGDAIQGAPIGALSKGQEIIKIMNRADYDLAVPGNHEFDYGFEELDNRSEELKCGYTCANFCVLGGDPVFEPWKMLKAGDLNIAFIGVVTPDTFTKTSIKNIVNEVGEPMYDFLADENGDKLSEALQIYIDEAKEKGADYVILVSHLGNNGSISPQFSTGHIVGKLSGLDMVIDGHSHEIVNDTLKDRDGKIIPIAQTGTKFNRIGQISIYKDGHMEEKLIEEIPSSDHLPCIQTTRGKTERYVDPEMKEFMDKIAESYASIMERKIGYVSYDMLVRSDEGEIGRIRESGLGNLVADSFKTIGNADAAFTNSGAVRDNMPEGEITYKDVMTVLPYSNDLVTIKVSGQTILDALEFGVSGLPEALARFPQVSGITFKVNTGIPSSVKVNDKNMFVSVDGEYKVHDVMINGKPLNSDGEYTLATAAFLADGGDGYSMFKDAEVVFYPMMPDNEVLIKYISENLGGVVPEDYKEASGRIILE